MVSLNASSGSVPAGWAGRIEASCHGKPAWYDNDIHCDEKAVYLTEMPYINPKGSSFFFSPSTAATDLSAFK